MAKRNDPFDIIVDIIKIIVITIFGFIMIKILFSVLSSIPK
ncbi:MAG: hypothetical protein ABIJ58_00300 [Nanoarchaeota archaeon]